MAAGMSSRGKGAREVTSGAHTGIMVAKFRESGIEQVGARKGRNK